MITRPKQHWKKIAIVLVVVIILGLIGWLIRQGYLAEWTGFNYHPEVEGQVPGKYLWDWLELLIIPFVLAGGALWLERSERISDRKIAQERWENEQTLATKRREDDLKLAADRREDDKNLAEDQQREAALQAYIDNMTELLLDKEHPLRKSKPDDEVRVVARTRTLAALRKLDPVRKGMLLRFLSEGKLVILVKEEHSSIQDDKGDTQDIIRPAIIGLANADLNEADLRWANLSRADLSEADLKNANLRWADLSEADLSRADLSRADLSGADLSRANLKEADLSYAELSGADLSRANLKETDLSYADLSGARLSSTFNLTDIKLASVSSLKHATMPDGKIYDPAIHTFKQTPLPEQDTEE